MSFRKVRTSGMLSLLRRACLLGSTYRHHNGQIGSCTNWILQISPYFKLALPGEGSQANLRTVVDSLF